MEFRHFLLTAENRKRYITLLLAETSADFDSLGILPQKRESGPKNARKDHKE
jgi:hypothetical protein